MTSLSQFSVLYGYEALSSYRSRNLAFRRRLRVASTTHVADNSLHLTDNMRSKLKELGWPDEDVKKMLPEEVKDILKSKFTYKSKQKSDLKRQNLLDKHDDEVQSELEKARKRLELLELKRKSTVKFIDELYEKIEDMDNNSDGSDLSDRRLRHNEKRREEVEARLTNVEDQISAQNKLISAIIKYEDYLVDELQEINDTATLTSGPRDDELLEERIKDSSRLLGELQVLRETLSKQDSLLQNETNNLYQLRKKQEKSFLQKNFLRKFNGLDLEVEEVEKKLKKLNRRVKSTMRKIFKKENSLKNQSTEDSLSEIEDAYKNLPSFQEVKEDSDKDIAPDEKVHEEESKASKYTQKSEQIQSFIGTAEPMLRNFVIESLGPDVPNDPAIEKALRVSSDGIIKRAVKMQSLSKKYRRNPMHTSSILLLPLLYEVVAGSMVAVISDEDDDYSKQASILYDELMSAGLVKEALGFKDLMNGARGVGRKVKDVANSALDSGKKLHDNMSESLDRRKFRSKDVGPSRDFEKPMKDARENLKQLIQLESSLMTRLKEAEDLLLEAKITDDHQSALRIQKARKEIQDQIQHVGQQKNVMEQGLSHAPAPGAMREQERAVSRGPSDYEQAVSLMEQLTPKLVSFLALIPSDRELEQELLRQSDRIAQLANKLIQIGFKAKKKFPALPLTIQAYGYIFLTMDDALDRALRSNEGVESLDGKK